MVGMALCLGVPSAAEAASSCSGAFTGTQVDEFAKFFSPAYYPPVKFDADSNQFFVALTPTERQALKEPRLAASGKLTAEQATSLRGWLNENAEDPMPPLLTTLVGLANELVGIVVDVSAQWFTGSTSRARSRLSNIAGRVAATGTLEVYERVYEPKTQGPKTGRPEDQRFGSYYVYRSVVNGTDFTDILQLCTYELRASPLSSLPRRNDSSGAAIVGKSITEAEASAAAAPATTSGTPRSAQQCIADLDNGPAASQLNSLVAANRDNTVMLLRGAIATIDLQIAALSSCGNSADIRNYIAQLRAQKDGALKTCQQVASQPSICTVSPWRESLEPQMEPLS